MEIEGRASRSSSKERTSLMSGSGSLVAVEELQREATMESHEPLRHDLNAEGVSNGKTYRLYGGRFAGVVGIMGLNIVGGMNWPWFGPIANASELCELLLSLNFALTLHLSGGVIWDHSRRGQLARKRHFTHVSRGCASNPASV